MRMVVRHYVGNDEFFDRMLITIFFENLCWDKAMKYVLRFANCPYFCFFKHINDKALNACVHALIVTIDEHPALYHNTMCIDYCCITPDEMVSIHKGLKNVTWYTENAANGFDEYVVLKNSVSVG